MLSTGLAPIEAWALEAIGKLGVQRLNYLTDDPWNPAHRALWVMEALPLYDHVFSPRHANLEDLRQLGCAKISYLPFAYAPELHFPESPAASEEWASCPADVVFAGGADRDRVPYMAALIRAGFQVALYGGYWERYPEARTYVRGHADPQTLRMAISTAKVALCLVRRANRDGHVMRTFEVPAIGACMLTEDTEEHREIFGEEGKAVVYFRPILEMIEKLRWLLDHDDERQRLAEAAYRLIVNGRNTYKDRLLTMLELADNQQRMVDRRLQIDDHGRNR
jgi:spore maturation protein CgeB